MNHYLLLLIYSALILLAAFLGGWLPSRMRMSHTQMQCTISFVGGFMLGIGLLHLLPHGIAQAQSVDLVLGATLVGLLFTFFLIRLFHFHQHLESHPAARDTESGHGHHPEGGECRDRHPGSGIHQLSWTGVALGLSVHTLLDGLALGAAVISDQAHDPRTVLAGLGVFLAILLHKPLDAFSITSLMLAAGWSIGARTVASLGFAVLCPLGALLFMLGLGSFDVDQARTLGVTLGFSTGVFLCISLGDLLPEVQFHRHDRLKLSAAVLMGVSLAYAIGFVEPSQSHALHSHERPGNSAGPTP